MYCNREGIITDQSTTQPARLAAAVGAIEAYIAGRVPSLGPTTDIVRSSGVSLPELTQYVRNMTEFAHDAVAEFLNRGEHQHARVQSEQAAKYEQLDYVLTRELIQIENANGTIWGLRNVRDQIARTGNADLHNKAEATALMTAVYGDPEGSDLLAAISEGVSSGAPRSVRIRNFTMTVVREAPGIFGYSLSAPRVHRGELRDILADAIKGVRAQVSPEPPSKSTEGINHSVVEPRVQEPHTESRAKSMATATVIPSVKNSSDRKNKAIEGSVVSSPRKSRATTKNKAAAVELETTAPAPLAEATPVVVTPAVDTPAPQATEQAQEQAAEKHWTEWRGGPENLPESQVTQANADYSKWSEKNPEKVANITFEKYRDFRIEQRIKKEEKLRDAVEEAAVAAGAPSEKSWRLQTGGFLALSEVHKEQAKTDLAKLIEKDPKKAGMSIEQYTADVQEYCAKDKNLAKTMLINRTAVDRGAVNLSNPDHAHHFLSTLYKGERSGNNALGALRTSVEPGQSKSITLKDAFTLEVERSADDKTVRTTLKPLPGKEAEVKRMFDDAASRAFRRAGYEPQPKARTQTRESQDQGR